TRWTTCCGPVRANPLRKSVPNWKALPFLHAPVQASNRRTLPPLHFSFGRTAVRLYERICYSCWMSLSQGTKVGAYEIQSLLGAGGMGEVYRARDPRLGRDVAVKVLSERFIRKEDALLRLEREAKTLAALSHPHILTIHDIVS